MRISTKRILSILVGLVFLMGALSVYMGLIRGEMDAVGKIRALLASKEAFLAHQERAVEQVKGLINEFKNFESIQAKVSYAVPNGVSAIQALRQIEAVGRSAGAVLTGLDFATPTQAVRKDGTVSAVKRLRVLEIKARAEGPYANLKQFVKLLETSVRVANVKTFHYTPGGNRGSGDTLTMDVEMYYQE